MNLEKFFADLSLNNLVEESRGRTRGVNEMHISRTYKPILKDLHFLYNLVRERERYTLF